LLLRLKAARNSTIF